MDYMKAAQAFGFLERQSQNYITMACTEMGVSYSEYVFLSELLDHEGIRQDDMAAILCVDKAQVTRTIKSLETKGFVYRVRSEADKRVRFVYSTERAKQEQAYMNRLLNEWIQYLTSGMEEKVIEDVLHGLEQLGERAKNANLGKLLAKLNP